MISALNTAASGLHAANQKFERAAGDVIRSSTGAGADAPDLINGVVALSQAEVQVAASAKVFDSIARTQGRLLDILA